MARARTISVEALTNAIMDDRQRDRPREAAPLCFSCGRAYTSGAIGDVGRFCSLRCRDAFDSGFPAYAPPKSYRELVAGQGPLGMLINCSGCGKKFDSRGLRCCSIECERAFRRKEELDAELARQPFRAVKRRCGHCGGPIPNWRKGRRVSSAVKYCSSRCQRKGSQNAEGRIASPRGVLVVQTAKKCPENKGARAGSGKG
jgi:hypothetical protein